VCAAPPESAPQLALGHGTSIIRCCRRRSMTVNVMRAVGVMGSRRSWPVRRAHRFWAPCSPRSSTLAGGCKDIVVGAVSSILRIT
jgi:hypothetical protein